MYQIYIQDNLQHAVMKAIGAYNDLLSGSPGFFSFGRHAQATEELGVLWDQLPDQQMQAPLKIDLNYPLSRSQVAWLIRAVEASVFLGDGRYCSILELIQPTVDRHPNSYLLRQAFLLAEQAFLYLGLEKQVCPEFREMAAQLREQLTPVRMPGGLPHTWQSSGIRIEKVALPEEIVAIN